MVLEEKEVGERGDLETDALTNSGGRVVLAREAWSCAGGRVVLEDAAGALAGCAALDGTKPGCTTRVARRKRCLRRDSRSCFSPGGVDRSRCCSGEEIGVQGRTIVEEENVGGTVVRVSGAGLEPEGRMPEERTRVGWRKRLSRRACRSFASSVGEACGGDCRGRSSGVAAWLGVIEAAMEDGFTGVVTGVGSQSRSSERGASFSPHAKGAKVLLATARTLECSWATGEGVGATSPQQVLVAVVYAVREESMSSSTSPAKRSRL